LLVAAGVLFLFVVAARSLLCFAAAFDSPCMQEPLLASLHFADSLSLCQLARSASSYSAACRPYLLHRKWQHIVDKIATQGLALKSAPLAS